MSETRELKACPNPWCGEKQSMARVRDVPKPTFRVICKCGVMGPMALTEAEAITAWNTRSTPTVEGGELVETLRTELAEAKDAARRSDQHAKRVAAEAADGFAAMEALDEFWDAVGYPNNRGTLTPAEQIASICRECDQAADALASRDAEIERLRGEVAEVYDQGRWIIRMADIREASGVGHKPMLDEVAGAIKAKIAAKDAALGEAERAINRAKEAVEDQDDIELVGSLDAALSTLKTAREG